MKIAISILITIGTACFMEMVAWFEHKYIMHGFLWVLHKDHHMPTGGKLQRNDLFALLFAVPSFLMIFLGFKNGLWPLQYFGLGLALYGAGYVIFHDIMFHKRIKRIKYKPKSDYMKGIITAHRLHHSRVTKQNGISFSFLWAPKRYSDKSLWKESGKGEW